MIRSLGENLAKFKDALAGGEAQRVNEFQALIQGILAAQDERKNKVTSELKEFQMQQQELAKTLKELLAKGRELRIKDLKRMLGEFQAQRQGRIAEQGERRKDVRDMLEESQKERFAAAKNRQDIQKKLIQASANPDGPAK
jgi:translation initiation factor 1 (eIF-1/SUI1)